MSGFCEWGCRWRPWARDRMVFPWFRCQRCGAITVELEAAK